MRKTNGRREIKAIKYLNPAKVRGGISFRPSLIITNDVDHKKVTRRASKSAEVREIGFEKIVASLIYFPKKSFKAYRKRKTAKIFFRVPSGKFTAYNDDI